MTDPFGRLRRFLRELKRRNVYKVAATYAVVAFVLIQVADLTFVRLGLPSWTVTLVIVLVGVGFPLAVILAWAFEKTPEGVRRTAEAEPAEEGASEAGEGLSTAYKVLVLLGLVAATIAGGWYLTGGGGTTVSDRSVAVLPFEAQGQEEPGAFTAGMHAALSSRLGNVSDLRVSPSRAVQAFEDTALSTAEIAGELGVAWMVTGNVQTTEAEVQVIVELVDPTTGTQRWSDEYTRDLTTASLFDLQSEISREIAASLEAELTPEERERIDRRPTGDLTAYRLYVRGRSQLNTRTAPGVRNALDSFQRAVERDSSYALAWAGYADALELAPSYLDSLPPGTPEQSAAARRALELDPNLAEAQASVGLVHFNSSAGPAALKRFQRAVELKPSYAQGHHWLGYLLLTLGRLEEADEHLRLAIELDPGHASARGVFAQVLQAQGEPERALTEARKLDVDVPWRPWAELPPLIELRRWPEVDSLLPRLAWAAGSWEVDSYRALVAAGTGDTARARDLLQSSQLPESFSIRLHRALTYVLLDAPDQALSVLSGAKEWRRNGVIELRYFYPDLLRPVRDDPRYEQVLREANRYWGLNPDGSLPEGVAVSFGAQSDD